jgi:Protein of unknown function VcgC/VcgE (DUF2780)
LQCKNHVGGYEFMWLPVLSQKRGSDAVPEFGCMSVRSRVAMHHVATGITSAIVKRRKRMKNKSFIKLLIIPCVVFSMTVLINAGQAAAPATSGLVDTLTKNLSLKPAQATGAAGSIFSLAKSKMAPADFTKLASGFPEMDSLLKATPKGSSSGVGGLTGAITNPSGALALANQFKSLGISPETATKIVPEVLNFVKAKQGDQIMGLLSKAIK